MGRLGLIEPRLRLPLCEPAPAVQRRLEELIEDYRLRSRVPAPAAEAGR